MHTGDSCQPVKSIRGRPREGCKENEDYAAATSCLLDGLRYRDPLDLLQFLRGVLHEVVKSEEAALEAAKEARAKRGGGFSMQAEDAPAEKRAEEVSSATRRWRRTVRAVFNAEAAMAMLNDLQDAYRSEEFQRSAHGLNGRWRDSSKRYAEKMADIEDLCLREVMGPVLLRYGFSPDKRGSAELRAVIADLANNNKDIRSMNMDIQKLVISNFPDLKSDQAEAAYRAASASTAVSTTEDSPKSNEATRPPSAYNWHPGLAEDGPKASRVK